MAKQSFDADVLPKLQAVRDELEDMSKKMVPAIEGSVELAKRNGIAKLQADAENAVEGTAVMAKAFDQLVESIDAYSDHVKRVSEALG